MKYWQIIKVRFVTILLVFLLTAVTTTVVSFSLPKTYMSMSRITVEKDTSDIAPLNGIQSEATAFDPYFIQTELEVIQSQKVLDMVVAKCNLAEKWKRIYGGNLLHPIEARKTLKKAIDIRQFRKTSIIELRAYGWDRFLAKDIAQALAEEYRSHRTDAQMKRVEIIKDADLPVRAVRPNIPLNITLGVVAGLILGMGLAFFIEYLDTAIVDAKNLLIKSGFNVSVDDLSTHHLAGGDVAMVATGMIKAKEKNIDLSFEQACALDLKAAKELDKLRKKSKLKFVDELSSEEEVEIMEPTANVRDYEVNDYVSLKNGGEGNIIKIIYVVMDDSEEVLFLKKCDLGNHTQRDI